VCLCFKTSLPGRHCIWFPASTLPRRNLKTQLYFCGEAHHLYLSATKTELFENALQTGGIWKRRLCVLVWTENILKTSLFENDDVTIIMWFPARVSLKHKSKMTGDCWVFKFLRRSVDGKHLMRFQSESAFLKFLQHNVDGPEWFRTKNSFRHAQKATRKCLSNCSKSWLCRPYIVSSAQNIVNKCYL